MRLALCLLSLATEPSLDLAGGERSIPTLRRQSMLYGWSWPFLLLLAHWGSLWRHSPLSQGVCFSDPSRLRRYFNSFHNSAAVIGLYTSYTVPIFLRITSGRNKLVPGPFTLGRWYFPIGVIAVAWVSFIVVLLLFPGSQAPTPETTSTSGPSHSISLKSLTDVLP